MKTRIILTLICAIAFTQLRSQRILVKSGIHYTSYCSPLLNFQNDGVGGGPGFEYGITSKLTAGVNFYYNYSTIKPHSIEFIDDHKLTDLMIQPELKYYPKALFKGFFIGINMGLARRKMISTWSDRETSTRINPYFRAGMTGGYMFTLNEHLTIETRAGFSLLPRNNSVPNERIEGLPITAGAAVGWRF
jgi:hypothetical protein